MREFFLKQDWLINGAVFLLTCFGLSAIYSTMPSMFLKQILFALIGFFALIIISRINYFNLKNYTLLFYIIILILLIAVLSAGQIRGVSSWFKFGQYGFQPVEFAKIIMIIVLASYFAKHCGQMHRWRYIITSGIYLALPASLILAQPELGSVLVLAFIWFSMALIAGIKFKKLLLIILILIIIACSSWFLILKDYQKNRLLIFLNPERDPLGKGYHVIQSIIAVGSGGFFGKGLGFGSQSQLNFLPEQHTDFIFAVIAEELGFFAVFFILILFGLIFFRGFKIILRARDNFGKFLALGVLTYLFAHIIINIGMNMGLMPITGIPLPLLSYGGSNLLITLIAIGLLQSVKNRSII